MNWIKELEELLPQVSPGPWRPDEENSGWIGFNDVTVWRGPKGKGAEHVCDMGAPIAIVGDEEEGQQSYRDAKLICLLRNHADEILERLRNGIK